MENTAENDYNEGLKYLNEDDLYKARSSFLEALRKDNINSKYFCAYCKMFFDENNKFKYPADFKSIISYFDKLQLDDNAAESYYFRGMAYENLAYDKDPSHYYSTPNKNIPEYTNAINDYTEAIKLDKTKQKYYYACGKLFFLLKEYDKAIEEFNNAIMINDTDPEGYNLLGRVYEAIGNNDEAIKNYIYSLHLDNSHLFSLFRLGYLSKNYLNDYEKAYDFFTKARELENNPDCISILDDEINRVIKLGNINIESKVIQYAPEETLFEKIINLVKSGVSQMSDDYNKKIEKIERNKEKFKNKSQNELRQIIMNSTVFEEKVAAKRLLNEMEQ